MTKSILNTYLHLNLLDLGGDDSRLTKLEEAAIELAELLAEKPRNALPIFLAAISDDNKVGNRFDDVATVIANKWPTYQNAFKDGSAVTLYRAVSLQAISLAIGKAPNLGTAISLLMRNFGPHLKLGKSTEAFNMLLLSADDAYDQECEAAKPTRVEVNPIDSTNYKSAKFDRAALQKRIEAAVGPTNRANTSLDNANPHTPNADPTNWGHTFAEKLTVTLNDYLDSCLVKAAELDGRNLVAVGDNLIQIASDNFEGLEQSNALLWWRQALYSESASSPYRALSTDRCVVHAVVDLSSKIPSAYEPALESFLAETAIYLKHESKIEGKALASISESTSSSFRDAVDFEIPVGLVSRQFVDGGDVHSAAESINAPELAVWLLRELKALQAVSLDVQIDDEEGDE